jgi:hypothetical protein
MIGKVGRGEREIMDWSLTLWGGSGVTKLVKLSPRMLFQMANRAVPKFHSITKERESRISNAG